jgi:hypothetical protein
MEEGGLKGGGRRVFKKGVKELSPPINLQFYQPSFDGRGEEKGSLPSRWKGTTF